MATLVQKFARYGFPLPLCPQPFRRVWASGQTAGSCAACLDPVGGTCDNSRIPAGIIRDCSHYDEAPLSREANIPGLGTVMLTYDDGCTWASDDIMFDSGTGAEPHVAVLTVAGSGLRQSALQVIRISDSHVVARYTNVKGTDPLQTITFMPTEKTILGNSTVCVVPHSSTSDCSTHQMPLNLSVDISSIVSVAASFYQTVKDTKGKNCLDALYPELSWWFDRGQSVISNRAPYGFPPPGPPWPLGWTGAECLYLSFYSTSTSPGSDHTNGGPITSTSDPTCGFGDVINGAFYPAGYGSSAYVGLSINSNGDITRIYLAGSFGYRRNTGNHLSYTTGGHFVYPVGLTVDDVRAGFEIAWPPDTRPSQYLAVFRAQLGEVRQNLMPSGNLYISAAG